MAKKTFLISEAISFPFDEGFKNISYHVVKNLDVGGNVHIVTDKCNNTNGLNVEKINLNGFFLNNGLRLILKTYLPDIILYIPEASYTFNSFIRARILKLMSNKSKVAILGAQHRKYSFFLRMFLNCLRPDLLFLLSKSDKAFFEGKGIKVKILPPAVDTKIFCQNKIETKINLRKKYGIPVDKTIIFHTGHIKASRNLEYLIDVQRISNVQVVIVGSTSTRPDWELKYLLEKQGIIIINGYIPNINEVYQLADIYVFPVVRQDAAIEMPLSILEAMACNLPVITTRFGGLVDYFKEDIGFRFFNTAEELVELIRDLPRGEIHNDKKLENFTWRRFTDEIVTACEEISI